MTAPLLYTYSARVRQLKRTILESAFLRLRYLKEQKSIYNPEEREREKQRDAKRCCVAHACSLLPAVLFDFFLPPREARLVDR